MDSIKDKILKKITDVPKTIKETTAETVENVKQVKETLEPVKDITSKQLLAAKAEDEDLKRIFDHDSLLYHKTPEIAIVLRKMGALDKFIETVNNLTKEGYLLVWAEDVNNITSAFGVNIPGLPPKLGSFYYFQHTKFVRQIS